MPGTGCGWGNPRPYVGALWGGAPWSRGGFPRGNCRVHHERAEATGSWPGWVWPHVEGGPGGGVREGGFSAVDCRKDPQVCEASPGPRVGGRSVWRELGSSAGLGCCDEAPKVHGESPRGVSASASVLGLVVWGCRLGGWSRAP